MNKDISSRILITIDKYVKGKLGPKEADKLWIQLLENPEYYPLFKTEAGLRKRYIEKTQLDKSEINDSSLFDAKRSWIIALAALLLLALFIILFRSQIETEIKPVVTEISLLHLVSPDVTRSSADQLSEFDQALHHSFQLTVIGEREKAISGYLELLGTSDTPENQAVLNYNLGISYYNIGDYEASSQYFLNVDCPKLNDLAYIESCFWLRTNSFLAIQDYDRAHDSAVNTLNMNGPYRDDAYDLLDKLKSIQ